MSTTSTATGIPTAFVEKDFWVTEVLRAVSAAAAKESSLAVFKGGTSLSKAYGILERFSEDVDILLVPPDDLGETARHGILRRICNNVSGHLAAQYALIDSTQGIKRNVRYPYTSRFSSGVISPGVLLEMGIRGGPNPRTTMQIDSIVGSYAKTNLEIEEHEFEEFSPVTVDVLASERTLVEKLALLHDRASRIHEPAAKELLEKSGRHYYDIFRLLGHDSTLTSCAVPGTIGRLANDVDSKSRESGWTFTARPQGGYSMSPAFDSDHESHQVARLAYDAIRGLIYGEHPKLNECLERIHAHRELL